MISLDHINQSWPHDSKDLNTALTNKFTKTVKHLNKSRNFNHSIANFKMRLKIHLNLLLANLAVQLLQAFRRAYIHPGAVHFNAADFLLTHGLP